VTKTKPNRTENALHASLKNLLFILAREDGGFEFTTTSFRRLGKDRHEASASLSLSIVQISDTAIRILDVTASASKGKDLVTKITSRVGDNALSRQVRFLSSFAELDVCLNIIERNSIARKIASQFLEQGSRFEIDRSKQLADLKDSDLLIKNLEMTRINVAKELSENALVMNYVTEFLTPRLRPAKLSNRLSASTPAMPSLQLF